MRVARILFCVALLLAAAGEVAWADGASPAAASATPPAPVAATVPASFEYCPLRVTIVRNLDDEPHSARTYALALRSDGAEGKASGTLALYVGNDRYVIPFHEVVAAGRLQSANVATPIVIRFGSAVTIGSVYIASLDFPKPAPCSAGNITSDPTFNPQSPVHVTPPFDGNLFDRTANALPRTPAILAEHEPPPACAEPYRDAKPISLWQPNFPRSAIDSGEQGKFLVAVTLSPTGAVVNAQLYGESMQSHALEAEAMGAAEKSEYLPEIFRCAPVFGTYIFTAVFQRQ